MSESTQTSDSLDVRDMDVVKECLNRLDKVQAAIDKMKKDDNDIRARIAKQGEEMEFWMPDMQEYYAQFFPKPEKRKREAWRWNNHTSTQVLRCIWE